MDGEQDERVTHSANQHGNPIVTIFREKACPLPHLIPVVAYNLHALSSSLQRTVPKESRRHVVERPSLCVVRLVLGVPSTLLVRISTL